MPRNGTRYSTSSRRKTFCEQPVSRTSSCRNARRMPLPIRDATRRSRDRDAGRDSHRRRRRCRRAARATRPRKLGWIVLAVAVHEADERLRRRAQPVIDGGALAQVRGKAQPAHARRGTDHRPGLVRAAVVDGDDFRVWQAGAQLSQDPRNQRSLIVERHDDRKSRARVWLHLLVGHAKRLRESAPLRAARMPGRSGASRGRRSSTESRASASGQSPCALRASANSELDLGLTTYNRTLLPVASGNKVRQRRGWPVGGFVRATAEPGLVDLGTQVETQLPQRPLVHIHDFVNAARHQFLDQRGRHARVMADRRQLGDRELRAHEERETGRDDGGLASGGEAAGDRLEPAREPERNRREERQQVQGQARAREHEDEERNRDPEEQQSVARPGNRRREACRACRGQAMRATMAGCPPGVSAGRRRSRRTSCHCAGIRWTPPGRRLRRRAGSEAVLETCAPPGETSQTRSAAKSGRPGDSNRFRSACRSRWTMSQPTNTGSASSVGGPFARNAKPNPIHRARAARRGAMPACRCRKATPASVVNSAVSVSVVMKPAARNGSAMVAYTTIGRAGARRCQ